MITYSQLGTPQWGRLGNQLFQIAATLGIAQQSGQDVVFPVWAYARYFYHPLPIGTLQDAQIHDHDGVFYKKINLPTGNWDLRGYFASEKFFDQITLDIRRQFTPAVFVLDYIRDKYGALLDQHPCSLHVRRGDYLKLNWDFPPQPMSYYQQAMKQFPSTTKFLVFSDDIGWCKHNFIGQQFSFIENEEDIIDLFLMSCCSNHIIANSTFSWWGAWLNSDPNKIVLCPRRWYGPGVSSHPERYARDLYAKGFSPIKIPGEKQWQIRIYYAISYPFYAIWSKIYATWLNFYNIKGVRYIINQGKEVYSKLKSVIIF